MHEDKKEANDSLALKLQHSYEIQEDDLSWKINDQQKNKITDAHFIHNTFYTTNFSIIN